MHSEHQAQFRDPSVLVRSQVGALCWRLKADALQVLLITSRETRRWVIPKGWPIDGLSASETAAREAWEEAGVTGGCGAHPLGVFGYDKVTYGPKLAPLERMACAVDVFSLRVDKLARRYPESRQRRRKWFTPTDAAASVAEPDLQALFLTLSTKSLAAFCKAEKAKADQNTTSVDRADQPEPAAAARQRSS